MSRLEAMSASNRNNIFIQKKLLAESFENELNDRLVTNIVASPAHSVNFKLKVQLENIVRLHSTIPMNLQKILCDFCMSEQFSSDYVFLIGYLEKSFQKIIFAQLIKKLNNIKEDYEILGATFAYFNSKQKANILKILIEKLSDINLHDFQQTTIFALGAAFADLDVKQKKLVLNKLIEKSNDHNSGAARSAAISTLDAVFVYLDVEQKTLVSDELIEKLNSFDDDVRSTAITALSDIFAYLNPIQKELVLDKLIKKLNDDNGVKRAALIALGAAFSCLDPEKRKSVFAMLIEKSNDKDLYYIQSAAISALGTVFVYLDVEQKTLVSDELIEKLNNGDWNYARPAAITALSDIFAYLNPIQKKLVLDKLIEKFTDNTYRAISCKRAAKTALKNIILYNALSNTLSPTEKKLFILNDKNRKVRVAEAISSFTIPYIKLTLSRNVFLKITKSDQNIFAAKQKKLTDALLAVNNIFYQNFLNPIETDQELSTIRDKMTDLIRVTQEKRFSTGLFYRAPGDTQSAEQLINYFKLPESLKARILLTTAFGFPDKSVIEFEKSLRQLIYKTFDSPEVAASSCVRSKAYAL